MISAKQIQQFRTGEKQIHQMSEDEIINMMEAFPPMLSLIGINADISNDELLTLENLLRSSFKSLTWLEIKYAFQLYIAGEIEVQKEFLHFGKFNMKFIGKLLNMYVNERNEALKHVPKETIKTSHQLNDKHVFDIWKEEYIGHLNYIKANGKISPLGNFDFCFNFLKAIGRIVISDSEYSEHIANVNQIINQEADRLQTEQQRKDYRKAFSTNKIMFVKKCRDEYFKKWMQEKLLENASLEPSEEPGKTELSFTKWIEQEIKEIYELDQRGAFQTVRNRIQGN